MFLLAVGRAPSGPVLDGIALASLPKLDRNAYGRVRRWGSVGFLLSVFVVGWLADHTVIEPFDVVLFTAIGFLALTMAMPQLGQIERVRIGFALRSLARDAHIWWVLLAAALHFGAHVGITAFLAVHLDSLGYGSAWTGTALALGVGIEVWVMTVAHRLLRRWDPTTLFLVATLVGMARWLVMEQTTSGVLLVGLQGLHGVSFGLFWIAGVAIMNRRAPSEVAISAQGLLAVAVGGVGSAIGTMGGSWIVTEMTTTDLFVGAQALSAVAILGALAVRWTR
jgi:PPP family 3-phenylpropionic acid transporter